MQEQDVVRILIVTDIFFRKKILVTSVNCMVYEQFGQYEITKTNEKALERTVTSLKNCW